MDGIKEIEGMSGTRIQVSNGNIQYISTSGSSAFSAGKGKLETATAAFGIATDTDNVAIAAAIAFKNGGNQMAPSNYSPFPRGFSLTFCSTVFFNLSKRFPSV